MMTSPFPGVDPFLEAQGFWPDFHATFINYWREALAEILPDHYEARIDERLNLVELPAEKVKRIEPDLVIAQRGPSPGVLAAPAGLEILEPVTIPLVIEEETRETYIEIRHRPERRLVAVLELLSPSSKEEPGRRSYLDKRNALLRDHVHLVELDLLLSGRRLPLGGDYPPGNYFALVSHADRRPNCHVYAWTIPQRLPILPIPLLPPDPDARVDLAGVFTLTFQRGRYGRSIDYAAAPILALSPAELDWVRQVAAAGRT
jgi:hypothetical protein